MEKMYTTFEVARICRVSPGSVIRWIKEGKLPASITAGGHHRVQANDLMTLLKSLRMPIPAELSNNGVLRILIVDDEPGIRQMVRWLLSMDWPDALIEEAEEGFSAGWKAHGMHPDLVLLDVMIPGMDGLRVCQFIRNFQELKKTKIIAMTGLQNPDIRDKMLLAGADDFIVKPFEAETLKGKIITQLGIVKNQRAA